MLDFVTDLRRIAAVLNIKRERQAEDIEVLRGAGRSRIEFSDEARRFPMDEWIKDAADLDKKLYDEARLEFPDPKMPVGG